MGSVGLTYRLSISAASASETSSGGILVIRRAYASTASTPSSIVFTGQNNTGTVILAGRMEYVPKGTWTTSSTYDGALNLYVPTNNASTIPIINASFNNNTDRPLIGIGTNTPTFSIGILGNAAQSIAVERTLTANTIGANLSVGAGGCTISATDKNAGMLYLGSQWIGAGSASNIQTTTGTGFTSVRIGRSLRAASTGTTLNTFSDALIIPSEFNLVDAGNNDLFEVALAANEMCGGHVDFTIIASDGTDVQSYTGTAIYAVVDKASTLSPAAPAGIVESIATSALSAGTLTTAWSIVDGANKITIRLVPTSSLVPTTMKIRYTIHNGSTNVITQL